MSDVLNRMLDKLPSNQSWFGANKAPDVVNLMNISATEISALANLIYYTKNAVFLMKATGDAVDLWGRDVEIPRFLGENDVVYQTRIQAEILRPRSAIPAIEKATLDILKLTSTVFEPWTKVIRFGQHSKLGGKNKLSGPYYTNAVIDIQLNGYDASMAGLADRMRACGIFAYITFVFQGGINGLGEFVGNGSTSDGSIVIKDFTSSFVQFEYLCAAIYDGSNNLQDSVTDPESVAFSTGGTVGYDKGPNVSC